MEGGQGDEEIDPIDPIDQLNEEDQDDDEVDPDGPLALFMDMTRTAFEKRHHSTSRPQLMRKKQRKLWGESRTTRVVFGLIHFMKKHPIVSLLLLIFLMILVAFFMSPGEKDCKPKLVDRLHFMTQNFYGDRELYFPTYCRVDVTSTSEMEMRSKIYLECPHVMYAVAAAAPIFQGSNSTSVTSMFLGLLMRRRFALFGFVEKKAKIAGQCLEDDDNQNTLSDAELTKCVEWSLDTLCDNVFSKVDCTDLLTMVKKVRSMLTRLQLLVVTQSCDYQDSFLRLTSENKDLVHANTCVESPINDVRSVLERFLQSRDQSISVQEGGTHLETPDGPSADLCTIALRKIAMLAERAILFVVRAFDGAPVPNSP